jgi:hypothetical protein
MLVLVLMVVPATTVGALGGGVTPHDSDPVHSVGWWNTSYTDSGSNRINATIFYPATSDGEGATREPSNAPYPLVCLVPHDRIRPVFEFYGSYGDHLARRGYVVAMVELEPYDDGDPSDYLLMANVTLEGIDFVLGESDRSGSTIEAMVNSSVVAVIGHGAGADVALVASLVDDGDRVSAVACLALRDVNVTGMDPVNQTGQLDVPLHVQGGSRDPMVQTQAWYMAFANKATGHASLTRISGANFTQYMDGAPPGDFSSSDWPATISREEQHNNTMKYLQAFCDRHLKGDSAAGDKLYGDQARLDLDAGLIDMWHYGVRDLAVAVDHPAPGSSLPVGTVAICATVTNVGPFPMPPRNVTCEVVKVVPGRAYQRVFGPFNSTTGPVDVGASAGVMWDPYLAESGNYLAFVRMGDPDHNASNDRAQTSFIVTQLLPPIIFHNPPNTVELGDPFNISCRITSPFGIRSAHLNFTNDEGITYDVTLSEDPTTGRWYALMPPPRMVGAISYTIHAMAGNNGTNSTMRFFVVVEDTRSPLIEHEPPWSELAVHSLVELNANVTDVGTMAEVRLIYTEPATGFHNTTCARSGDLWFFPVTVGPVAGVMEYSWYARDTWGNVASLGPFQVTIVDTAPPIINASGPKSIELGMAPSITAIVTDDAQVASLWVPYRMPGADHDTNGTPILLGGTWHLTLPITDTAGTITYSWIAFDINGRMSTTEDLEIAVIDTVAPNIFNIRTANATVGLHPVVDAEVIDPGGVASVRVEYVDVVGASGQVGMEEVLSGIWVAELPVQARGGALKYRIVAIDNSGNVGRTGERTMVVRDMSPPVFVHHPLNDLVEGEPVTITVKVTDDVEVVSVHLFLKTSPMGSFHRVEMAREGDTYSYTVDGSDVESPELFYYFEAEDAPPSSNVATSPDDAPQSSYQADVVLALIKLEGKILGREGKPLAGATLSIASESLTVHTDADGGYSMSLSPGTYRLVVRAKDYKDQEVDVVMSVEGGDREFDINLVPMAGTDVEPGISGWTVLGIIVILVAVIVVVMTLRSNRGR